MATSIPGPQSSAVEPGMAGAEPAGVVLLSDPPRTREPRAPPAVRGNTFVLLVGGFNLPTYHWLVIYC